MTTIAVQVPKHKFTQPSFNLPGRKGVATVEDRFTISFMRAYFCQARRIHRRSDKEHFAFAREIPVNGYGIADLVVLAMKNGLEIANCQPHWEIEPNLICTRAFECKITDWRKGMSQASRYRGFANQSILVLPQASCEIALDFMDTFRKIKVGLWSFSQSSGIITPHHTPRPATPFSSKYQTQALKIVANASKRALPIP